MLKGGEKMTFIIHKDGIVELTINCPECEEPIVLIKNGKEMKEEDCTCCGGYKIDVLHIAIIKVATIKAAAIKAIIRKMRQKLK